MYDILIVGAGPAGLTAAIYGRRAGKSVLIVDKGTFGGQITFSPKIENYPGFNALSGMELADKMVDQAMNLGAEIEVDTVLSMESKEDYKILHGESGDYEGKTVLIATGAKHRLLGAKGEAELVGEGISFCAVCDGAFFENGEVLVIGGGNSALQEALLLSETCSSVKIVQNLPTLTGEQTLQDLIYKKSNVSYLYSATVDSFEKTPDGKIRTVVTSGGTEQVLSSDGVFVAIGLAPDNGAFEKDVDLDHGYVKSDENCLTKDPAIFTCGDCRTKKVRQIATAISDGATAALAAIAYIDRR